MHVRVKLVVAAALVCAVVLWRPTLAFCWGCECHWGPAGRTCYGPCAGGKDSPPPVDDGAPCRGGWFHGPIWNAILGECPPDLPIPQGQAITAQPPNVHLNTTPGAIIPDSSTRRISPEKLAGLSLWQLQLARNEMFARKGRYFQTPALQQYFYSFPWYRPGTWNVKLNAVETANVEIIKQAEAQRAAASFSNAPIYVAVDTDEPSCLFDGRGVCKSSPPLPANSSPAPGYRTATIGNMQFKYPVISKQTFDRMPLGDKAELRKLIEQREQREAELPNVQRALSEAKKNPANQSPQGEQRIDKIRVEGANIGKSIDVDINPKVDVIGKKYRDADAPQ